MSRSKFGDTTEYGVQLSTLADKITNTGGEFIVIMRSGQSQEPLAWSTGDKEQTEHLFDEFTKLVSKQDA